jgi:hypothetical protein
MENETTNKKRRRRKTDASPSVNINYSIAVEEDVIHPNSEDAVVETMEPASTDVANIVVSPEDTPSKKRGRKPKGGKIILNNMINTSSNQSVSNVILHLKCSMQDLNDYNVQMNQQITDPLLYNPAVPPNIMTYNNENNSVFSLYNDDIDSFHTNYAYNENIIRIEPVSILNEVDQEKNKEGDTSDSVPVIEEEEDLDYINMKDIQSKLKRLKINLYKNTLNEKKSACFWCTYPFDNLVCYIPKYEMDGNLNGYGSFCRPECAVAYLMKETIDDSAKFERYQLLNRIYSKVYNYKKNIKPAPNPYYLLDKYYGNLSIQEYRKLLRSEHMLLVIDKPLTRILPELHEDNEEFILNMYGNKTPSTNVNTTGVYKVKKQSEKPKGPSKNSIMRDNFGLSQ